MPPPFLNTKYSWKRVETNQNFLQKHKIKIFSKKLNIKIWRQKYFLLKNWHIYFANTLGHSFPHTSGTSWCVENSDL